MPRHRRSRPHHRRRRRHVGGFGLKGKDTTLKLLSLAGGFFMGKTINAGVDKIITKMTPAATPPVANTQSVSTIATVGEIGVGGLLLMMRKPGGTTGKIMKVAGGVLAGAGIRRAIGQMGFMNGFQSVPVIGRHRMAGYQSVPVIGQRTIPPQLAGNRMPAQLQGFRVNGYTPTGSGVMGSIGAIEGGSGLTNTGGGGYMG